MGNIRITPPDPTSKRPMYGVSIQTESGKCCAFADISPFRQDAQELCLQLQKADALSEFHLADIVRDFLTSLYFRQLEQNGLPV